MKMPKAYSLLLIGTGIFVYWLIVSVNIEYSIDNELNGFPARHEIAAYRANTSGILNSDVDSEYLEILRPKVDEYRKDHRDVFAVILMNTSSQWSVATGFLILFSGGILLLIEKLRHVKSKSVEKKPVNLKWQIVCSFLPGFDLWALYRIQKLRIGSVFKAIQYGGGMLVFYSIISQIEVLSSITLAAELVFTVFVYLWSRDWNRNLESKKDSGEGSTLFIG